MRTDITHERHEVVERIALNVEFAVWITAQQGRERANIFGTNMASIWSRMYRNAGRPGVERDLGKARHAGNTQMPGVPHEALFEAYATAVERLAQLTPMVARELESTLRGFELTLLEELGYGLTLTHEADSDTAIDPKATYHYAVERGPVRIDDATAQRAGELGALAGRTLLALAQRELSDATVLVQAKLLMRRVISHHLGEKSLHTRLLVRELK